MKALLKNRLACLDAFANAWMFQVIHGDQLAKLEYLRVPNAKLLPCIYIDPLKVEFKCNLRGAVQTKRTLVRGGDWDLRRKTFAEVEATDPRYISCRELLDGTTPIEQLLEFRQLLSRLEQRGEARGMKSYAQLYEYMQGLQSLYRRIADTGRLMTQPELGRCAFGGEINCAVSRDGLLMKTDDGNHRFAIARALGLREVPVQISVIHANRIAGFSGDSACSAVNKFFLDIQCTNS
ncbi:hypothetical protein [Pseudomonas sp. 1928-m]|uniref:hypothetical protein n=1 Tax=Pseudomonas sp. 1928-m TaxID=3033804 RepID=UPI0023DE79AE|nr:hypothetical protein [Pseudomonas sp. 1928-m]MDF3194672.1 hypothetical protein [Pseudomonas sp. 1928-m]